MNFSSDRQKVMYEAAGNLYNAGFNCAESVFRAFCEHLPLNVSEDALRVAAGFGGGMSSAEGYCGAATGGIMVLGILAGRTAPTQDKKPMKELTKDFLQEFAAHFGGLSCGCLNKYENGSPEQKKNCHAITAGAAALLMKFIEERQLLRR